MIAPFKAKILPGTRIISHRILGTKCLFLLLFCWVILFGCSGATSNVEASSEEMAQFISHLETLQVRYDLTSSLKTTEMKVTIQEDGRKPEELRNLLWYKKSEDGGELLHIQALGGFNETKGVVIANRNDFLLFLHDEQETYFGELSDGVLKKIFGIDLRVSDVLSAIFANPFLDKRTEKLKIKSSRQKFVATRPGVEVGHTETITLLVKDDEPRVSKWHVNDKKGKLQQSVVFSDYREVGGILRPHKVEIERPLEKTKVVVKIGKVQLNVDIADSRFDLEPFLSEDIKVIPLSELTETDELE